MAAYRMFHPWWRALRLRGLAIGFAGLVMACGDAAPTEPATNNALLTAFDSVWQRYDDIYAYFEYKHVDWAAVRARYRPQAAQAVTADALALVVRQMLGELRDVHAWMTNPSGQQLPTYTPTAFVNWQSSIWNQYMQRLGVVRVAPDWGYARIERVPYLYFASWGTGRVSLAGVDSVLELFRDAPAIVIDTRMNPGGNSDLADGVAARFFDAPRLTSIVQFRNGPDHSSLGAPYLTVIQPRGSWRFLKPVLVLTGRAMFSSAERFVMDMDVLPHVTVVGDTTGGGSGNPTTFDLAGGWHYSVPRWIERTPTGAVVEWQGLAPGIYVPASPADFAAGKDPVLEYAMRWAAGR